MNLKIANLCMASADLWDKTWPRVLSLLEADFPEGAKVAVLQGEFQQTRIRA